MNTWFGSERKISADSAISAVSAWSTWPQATVFWILKLCLNILSDKQESALHRENWKLLRTPPVEGAYQTTEENINLCIYTVCIRWSLQIWKNNIMKFRKISGGQSPRTLFSLLSCIRWGPLFWKKSLGKFQESRAN